jgi:hypothetical protein
MKLIITLILVLIVIKLFFYNKKENFNQEINYENEYQIALIKSELSKEATKQAEEIANSAAAVARAASAASTAAAAVSKVAQNKAEAEQDPDALTVSSEIVAKAATTAAAAAAAIAKFTTNKANSDKETATKKAAEQSELEKKLEAAKKAVDNNKPRKIWKVFWSAGEGSVIIMFGNKQALHLNVRGNGTVMNTWDGNNWGAEVWNINQFHNAGRPFNFNIIFTTENGFTIEYNGNDIGNLPNRFSVKNFNELVSKVSDPNNILVTTDIPKNILDMSPMGWFDASTFNPTSGNWFSKVGDFIINTNNVRKSDDLSHVFGGTNSSISNIPWPGENKDYTFFHIAKYNGNNRGRIWSGTTGNWLSGFWMGGVAFYHEGWYDNNINVSKSGNDWLLTLDYKDFVRVNKGQYQKNGPSYGPASIIVNNDPIYTREASDFAIAEFIIFNRVLSEKEYLQVEDYLSKKYLETKIELNYPITKNFDAPLGQYSSNCGSDCNCHMDFKVLYEVTKNNIKYRSYSSNIIGTANNCPNYWNPTLYFTITNKPNINETVNLVLLVSRAGKNDWYYTTADPITLESAQEQNIRIGGGTATFGEKYTEPMAEFYEHCDYNGNKVSLGIGEWNWSENVGIRNDSLSSVKVPLGLKVILYYDANYQGGSVELTKDTPCLTSTGINDLTSSIRIMRV